MPRAAIADAIRERLRDEVRFFIESHEASLTRYGIFDGFVTVTDLERLFKPSPEVERALGPERVPEIHVAVEALVREGDIIRFEDGPVAAWRLRSRMAELVRLSTKLRQRFPEHRFFTNSKELVQDVHFEVRARRYPLRDQPFETLRQTALRAGASLQASPEELRQVWSLIRTALDPSGQGKASYSKFQTRAFNLLGQWLIDAASTCETFGLVVGAGTGAGKTNAFFLPSLGYVVLEKVIRGKVGTKAIAVYPRQKLAQNQLETFLAVIGRLNMAVGDRPMVTIALDYEGVLYRRSALDGSEKSCKGPLRKWRIEGQRAIFPAARCPAEDCQGDLFVPLGEHKVTPPLTCATCGRVEHALRYVREDWTKEPADFLIAVTESLNTRMLSGAYAALFGDGTLPDGKRPTVPAVLMLDEIHLHVANKGMQIGFLVRRLRDRLRRAANRQGVPSRLVVMGLSATIAESQSFFHKLTGVPEAAITVIEPAEDELARRGSEYFLFLKAHPDARTGAISTLLQGTMALVHNMPHRSIKERYLTLGFADSHDLVGRWSDQFADAERQKLFALRDVAQYRRKSSRAESYFRVKPADCAQCLHKPNADCIMFREGECWWPMSHQANSLRQSATLFVESAHRNASLTDYQTKDLGIATSRLEVGYDDDRIMAVIQYQAPTDAAAFVQRKGRAGREYDTYPITMAVFNPYRTRDAFYFQNPHLLTSPVFKELPLNTDNRLIHRVHGFYAMFEYFIERAMGEAVPNWQQLQLRSFAKAFLPYLMHWTTTDADLEELKEALRASLGLDEGQAILMLASEDGVLRQGLRDFLARVAAAPESFVPGNQVMAHYVPANFFSDINLPQLRVLPGAGFTRTDPLETMDLAPGLRATLPGKVSWRGDPPYWLPPTLTSGAGRRWFDLTGDAIEVDRVGVDLLAQDVPDRVRRRLDLSAQGTLPIYRPRSVRVEPFRMPGASESCWFVCKPASDGWRSVQRSQPGDRLDERSTAWGIGFDHVRLDLAQLPADAVFTASQDLASGAFGSYRDRLSQRIGLVDWRRPMHVLRLTAGGEMNLKWRGGKGYAETYSFQKESQPCLVGYELMTEGLAIDLTANAWAQPPEEPNPLAALRRKFFAYRAALELQALGINGLQAVRLIDVLITVWGTSALEHRQGDTFAEALLGDGLRPAIALRLRTSYHMVRKDEVDEILALFDRLEVRSQLHDAWNKAHVALSNPQVSSLKDLAWDIRILSLSQAILQAAQDLSGVQVGEQLSVRAPLRQDEGRRSTPTLFLFEEGIGGLGIARSLHERFRSHPAAFWDSVEAHLRHCPVGDDEDVVHGLLALELPKVEHLAGLAERILEATSLMDRSERMQELQLFLRREVGLDPTPAMIKALLRVFNLPLSEWGLDLSNWRLYREINVIAEAGFFAARGYPARNSYEFTEAVIDLMQQDPATFPALRQLNGLLAETLEAEWVDRLVAIQATLHQPVAKAVFDAIPSMEALEELIAMGEGERLRMLRETYGIRFSGETPEREAELLQMLDQTHISPEDRLLWPESAWRVNRGQEAKMKERFALERNRDALGREIMRRWLISCRSSCPSCLQNGSLQFADRDLLDRRWTYHSLLVLRAEFDLPIEAGTTVQAVLASIQDRFRVGHQRCALVFTLDQQDLVSEVIARLASGGIRLQVGRHAVAIATTQLRSLNLPTRKPLYEVSLELGDIRA